MRQNPRLIIQAECDRVLSAVSSQLSALRAFRLLLCLRLAIWRTSRPFLAFSAFEFHSTTQPPQSLKSRRSRRKAAEKLYTEQNETIGVLDRTMWRS